MAYQWMRRLNWLNLSHHNNLLSWIMAAGHAGKIEDNEGVLVSKIES